MPSSSDSMKRLVELASRQDLKPFENAWTEAIAAGGHAVEGFLTAASALESQGQNRRSASCLALLLPDYMSSENFDSALPVLKRLAEISPTESGLRKNLLTVYRSINADVPETEVFLEQSGLSTSGGDIVEQVKLFEIFLSFRPGGYIFHPAGWGVGTIESINPEETLVTIDFAEKKGHELSMEMASSITRHIPKNSFMALKYDRLDELRDLADKDPAELVKSVVRGRNRPTRSRDIRDLMTDGVLPLKDWTRWWNRARNKVKRDENIKMAAGNNPLIEVTEVVQSFEEITLRNVSSMQKFSDKIKFLRGLHGELETHPETTATFLAAVQLVARLAPKATDVTPGAMLSLALLMDKVPALDDTVTIPEPLQVETLITDPDETLAALPTIPVSADRKEILNRLQKVHDENWEELFEKALYLGQNDVGDHCLKALLAANVFDRLTRTIFDILKQFRKYRGSFMWLYRAINGRNYHDALPNPGKVSLLERLLLLHTHVHNNFCKTDSADLRKEFRLIEKTLQNRKYAWVRETLVECSDADSVRIYNMVRNSRSLPDDVKDGVVAAILRTRPAVGKVNVSADENSSAFVDDRTIWVSRLGYELYETEFNKLVNDEIPANAKEIGRAADHGDLSENAEWTAALEKQGILTRRAEEMRDGLDRARVIDESMVAGDTVAVGCRIVVENVDAGTTETLTLLGPWEADTSKGIISYLSPLGRGLLGLTPGTPAAIELPAGTTNYCVKTIENALAASAD